MSNKGPAIAPRSNLAPSPIAVASPPAPVKAAPKPVSSDGFPKIITSKEWVLPPRPKPGRKPSVDTPASKRKAQNRAAQRAFRERRATRVQELEEKLLELEKEKEVKEMGLVNTINKMKIENQFLMKSLEQMRNEINQVKTIQAQRFSPANPVAYSPQAQVKVSPGQQSTGSPAGSTSSYSVQQILPAPSADSPPVFHQHQHRHSNLHPSSSLTPISNNTTPDKPNGKPAPAVADDFDCGICLKDECLCASVGLKQTKSLEETINTFKPMAAVSLKRKAPAQEQEIDFTTQFAKKPMPDLKKLKRNSNNSLFQHVPPKKEETFNEASPVENCGFCSDDTPCVCREAAKEAARLNDTLAHEPAKEDEFELDDETLLPPIQLNNPNFRKTSLPVMHPGPSVEIRDITNLTPGAVPTVVRRNGPDGEVPETPKEETGGCTGNPGACQQCQTDPMSTLFCATVANKVKEDEDAAVNSPGPLQMASPAKASPPSISRLGSTSKLPTMMMLGPSTPIATTPGGSAATPGMFIPCADAYKTLSRHKKFNSVDFSTLVGKLTTRGMQVEVQSVANVLRELDRRLYN